jgi:hypothetical protein
MGAVNLQGAAREEAQGGASVSIEGDRCGESSECFGFVWSIAEDHCGAVECAEPLAHTPSGVVGDAAGGTVFRWKGHGKVDGCDMKTDGNRYAEPDRQKENPRTSFDAKGSTSPFTGPRGFSYGATFKLSGEANRGVLLRGNLQNLGRTERSFSPWGSPTVGPNRTPRSLGFSYGAGNEFLGARAGPEPWVLLRWGLIDFRSESPWGSPKVQVLNSWPKRPGAARGFSYGGGINVTLGNGLDEQSAPFRVKQFVSDLNVSSPMVGVSKGT